MTLTHSVYFFILKCLGRLPFRCRRFLGRIIGDVMRLITKKRRHIVERNLQSVFPQLPAADREKILRAHFCHLGEGVMDTFWSLTASPQELSSRITLEGLDHLPVDGQFILFSPHFIGVNVTGPYLSKILSSRRSMFFYKRGHSHFWNIVFSRQRCRFGAIGSMITDINALRSSVRHLKSGGLLYYLPDINAKRSKSMVFAPFLAVQNAATYTDIGRLAKMANARVLPCLSSITPEGYSISIKAPLENFVGASPQAIANTVNSVVAEHAKRVPAQYYWVHRRFKTRPEGEGDFYA